jgi:predicted homoserine dehydrogenase-like protein
MGDIVRIALVGAGRTGMPLLEDFLKRPYVKVIGVADRDPESPGAKLARENDIFFTVHPDVLAAKAAEIDVIIEVSGDPTVKPALKDAFQAQGNRHTIILQDVVARLFISIIQNSNELVETVHPGDEGIG